MNLRFKIITHKKIQLRLASIFLLWFVVFGALFALIFLTNFSATSDLARSLPFTDQLLANMVLVRQTQDLAWRYGLAMLGYCLFVWTYILVYSHRITGPVHKLTLILKKAAETGEAPKSIRFRKTDAFPELEKAFNEFLESQSKKKRA
jgi:methyl-accepting chemotaxis protein